MKRTHGVETTLQQFRLTTSVTLDRRILDDACAVLAKAASPPAARPWYEKGPGRFVRIAAGVALAAAVLLVAIVLWDQVTEEPSQTVRQPKPTPRPSRPPDVPDLDTQLANERRSIETMAAARDIDGLVTVLEEGRTESKLFAATYLVEIGDERALPALSRLAGQWQGDPTANPFTKAIEQINSRRQYPEPNAPDSDQGPQGQVVPETGAVSVLSGTITDIDTGQPIEGVLVHVSPSGGGRVHEVTTDSRGVYAFDAVGNDGAYNVLLKAPEHVTPADWERPRETIQLRRGGRAVKDYVLARGGEILATVVDEEGKPVRRANIYASYVVDEVGRGPKRPVRTDADGVVSLGGLRSDEYLITVSHRDYALAGQIVVLEQPGQVKSIVFSLEKGVDIVGVATCSDGLPAGGWQIRATPQWWHSVHSWPGDDVVAEDGTFVLPHIAPGVHRLSVYIPFDGGARGIWSTDVNLPPETDLLDLQIPKPSSHGRVSISGVVTFVGGEPDKGFWINAYSDVGNSTGTYLDQAEREFALNELVTGLYTISITILDERHDFTNVKAPSEGIVLEIPVAQAVRLRGRVIDRQTRQPISRFQLRRVGDRDCEQISDPNGAFEVTSRDSDGVRVMIRAEGYGDKMVELAPGTNETTVIELAAPLAFAGVVVDDAGQPIEGATVSYRYRRSRDESPEGKYITSTDAEGRFRVDDVPPNDIYHWFVFRHPDYARCMRLIPVQEDTPVDAQVVLQKGGAVEGCVYDWRGKPLPDTVIYFMDESHFPYWKQNRARLGKVTTDGDGYYHIEHLPEELCYAFRRDSDNQLGVVLSGILPQAGRTVRLDLGGTWNVSGRLLAGGEPMANTKLLVTYEVGIAQAFMAYALSDSLGRFSLRGMPTGRRCLYWAVPGGHDWGRWIELGAFDFEGGCDLQLGDLVVTTAQVTVELVAGEPAVSLDSWDVAIQEYDELHYWGRRVGQCRPRTDHLDPFVFSYVSTGRYEAVARKEGYPSVRQVFEIAPRQNEHVIVLTLPSGSGTIAGTLESVLADRLPSTLMLRSIDDRLTAKLPLASDGTFAAEHLPAGQYAIGLASAALARRSTLQNITLKAAEHKKVRIQMTSKDAGRAAEGYLVVLIVTEEGLPLATPDVWLEGAARIIEPHFNTDDGKSFTGQPGTYTLHAQYPGYRSVRRTVEMKSRQDGTTQEIFKPLVITMVRP